MIVDVEERAGGVLIPLRVRAGGRRNAITGEHAGSLRVEVTAAPEKGKANQAVVELLATTLGVAKSRLEIISGAASSQKRLLVTGISLAEVGQRLTSALSAS